MDFSFVYPVLDICYQFICFISICCRMDYCCSVSNIVSFLVLSNLFSRRTSFLLQLFCFYDLLIMSMLRLLKWLSGIFWVLFRILLTLFPILLSLVLYIFYLILIIFPISLYSFPSSIITTHRHYKADAADIISNIALLLVVTNHKFCFYLY